MSKRFGLSVVIAIALTGCFIWLCIEWVCFLITPLIASDKPAIDFVIKSGDSVKTLVIDLQNKRVLRNPYFFVLLTRIKGEDQKIQAGEYRIDPGITPSELLHKLVTNKVILYPFTIVEGWTFRKMISELENNPHIIHTLQGLSDNEIIQRIGHPNEVPEGRFFPDTYNFSAGTYDVDILQWAYTSMQHKLSKEWQERNLNAPYDCPYKALIVASIIEKEASSKEERSIISGIIVRRLQKNMYLQLDASVIYGLGDSFKGKLTTKDLKKNTPYNTYLHKRLPPTPICLPSENAIHATLHPVLGTVLYFVAKGDGSHVFSSTLKAQIAAINKYQLKHNHEK
ncbi:MAG: hypothetical protein AMJ43_02095 [Coxiella sp. DG_40]|nr:MAG: hypothetical protein AMJ43_02095 [Coxiella sp. DG_40]